MSLDQYWDVTPKRVLYPKDEYHRKHTFEMSDFIHVAFVTGFIATGLVFVVGVLPCLL